MRMPANTALLIIDVQKAIDDPVWSKAGLRNNRDAERNIARLLERWRLTADPIFHIRHDSVKPVSPYRPDQPGNAFKAEARPIDGEPIIPKTTNNAFIRTDLEQRLRSAGINTLVVAGVITNNSVEATVRMAGNLGFNTYLVEDATFTFARHDYRGVLRSAEESPTSGSRTRLHAFTHGTSCPSRHRRTSPKTCMRCLSRTWTANTAESSRQTR